MSLSPSPSPSPGRGAANSMEMQAQSTPCGVKPWRCECDTMVTPNGHTLGLRGSITLGCPQDGLSEIFPSGIYLLSPRPSRMWETLYICILKGFLYKHGVWKASFLAEKNQASKINVASIISSTKTRAAGLPSVAKHFPEGLCYPSVGSSSPSWARALTSAGVFLLRGQSSFQVILSPPCSPTV